MRQDRIDGPRTGMNQLDDGFACAETLGQVCIRSLQRTARGEAGRIADSRDDSLDGGVVLQFFRLLGVCDHTLPVRCAERQHFVPRIGNQDRVFPLG